MEQNIESSLARRVSNYQSRHQQPIQSPAKRQGDGSAYSCFLTSTPHSYSRLFVRAILYLNQGLTHKRRVGVSFYVFRVLGHIRGKSAKQRKNCCFSLEIEKEFALKTEWCCSVKINRERNSVWRFILQHFSGGLICTNNNFYASPTFSFSDFQAENDARSARRKPS